MCFGQVGPEVADGLRVASRQAPDQRYQNRHAGCSGHKILHGESQHLSQIAQRRFPSIGLPVGVGRETRSRVERQVGSDTAKTLLC